MKKIAVLILITGLADTAQASDPRFSAFDFSEIRRIAVQHNGRVKPLDSLATEVVSKITGRAGFQVKDHPKAVELPGGNATAVFLSWMIEPELWQDVPLVKISYKPFKRKIGLDPEKSRFPLAELQKNRAFRELQRKAHAKSRREGENAKQTREEREVMKVAGNMQLLDAIFQGYACNMVPHPTDPMERWLPVLAVKGRHPSAMKKGVPEKWQEVSAAFKARDAAGFAGTTQRLRSALNSLVTGLYGDDAPEEFRKIEREVFYSHLHPFRYAAAFYFVGLVMLLLSYFFGGQRFYWSCLGVLWIGVLVQIYGFILRMQITHRPPVSNMFESMVFMGFMVTVFAVCFEAIYKSRIFATAAGFLSVFLLVLADQLPLDSGLDPLVPVLRTNYWLTVHVLTIMAAYSALTLAMGVGHINLGIYFFTPQKKKLLGKMTIFLYRTLQLGFLLLTAGTILGAWWAGEAWGRYWGWDPKETWAFICILGYGILLHGRFAGFWGPFGTAIGSVISWSLVGMCYYGVNFVLGAGLHSYGFGDGGIQFAIGYAVVEAIIVALAFYGRYGSKFRSPQRNNLNQPPIRKEKAAPGNAEDPGAAAQAV